MSMTKREAAWLLIGAVVSACGSLIARHFRGGDFHSWVALSVGIMGIAGALVLAAVFWSTDR